MQRYTCCVASVLTVTSLDPIVCFEPPPDTNVPRKPAVAVASGPYVFIYRNLRPYFKFTLPPVELTQQETHIWQDLRNGKCDSTQAYELLSMERYGGASGVCVCVAQGVSKKAHTAHMHSQRQWRVLELSVAGLAGP